eukprot:709896-Pyramimonas_sp.AAC.2
MLPEQVVGTHAPHFYVALAAGQVCRCGGPTWRSDMVVASSRRDHSPVINARQILVSLSKAVRKRLRSLLGSERISARDRNTSGYFLLEGYHCLLGVECTRDSKKMLVSATVLGRGSSVG